jgi:HD-GYP domain-containing protein (c-di-GMP phosphodiesterase class II)
MPSATLAPNASVDPLRGYLPVHVDMLKRVDRAPVDVFVQSDRNAVPTLYCRAGLPMENQQLLGLADAGIRDVYVRTGDFQDFGEHLLESVEALLEHDTVSPADRFAALQLAVAVEVENTVRLIDCTKFVSLSGKVGRDIASFVAGNDVVPKDLFRIARHDFNTFTHVTNVASYSVLLAEAMGITDERELEQIAMAAMLHDVGKRFIPASILNKPTRLDPDERDIIESHPTRGYEDLCHRPELTTGQLMIVYQHHERVDGNGYPVGVPGSDIHPWAKIAAVADVFDAMTGKRPYRRSITAQEALQFISRNAGTHFDPEVAQCWVSAMKKA